MQRRNYTHPALNKIDYLANQNLANDNQADIFSLLEDLESGEDETDAW